MPSWAFFNGKLLPQTEICISPLDRGFLFADGVYEVISVYNKRIFALKGHIARLIQSLQHIGIANPYSEAEWMDICRSVVLKNTAQDSLLYMQVTRGMMDFRHHKPHSHYQPTVVVLQQNWQRPKYTLASQYTLGYIEDTRWAHTHIKSTMLLANVMAKNTANEQGWEDMIFVNPSHQVLEASSGNIFIVQNHQIITPPLCGHILAGVTRDQVMHIARELGYPVSERPFTIDTLKNADEVWLTSTGREIMPITEFETVPVKDGKPGPIWQKMQQAWQEMVAAL